jgi:hypothetical protein
VFVVISHFCVPDVLVDYFGLSPEDVFVDDEKGEAASRAQGRHARPRDLEQGNQEDEEGAEDRQGEVHVELRRQDHQSPLCEKKTNAPAESTANAARSENTEKKDGMAFEPVTSPLCKGNSNLNNKRLYQREFQFVRKLSSRRTRDDENTLNSRRVNSESI